MNMQIYGGIEGGGTKFVCAVGSNDGTIRASTRFPTTDPQTTLTQAITFFREHAPLTALGIGSFGPLELGRAHPQYGWITETPKAGWRNVPIVAPLASALGIPIACDTDVNAAAFGEWCYGALRGLDVGIYLTIGTGIGGGAIIHGKPIHGIAHPEMGHMRIMHDQVRDPFAGICPYHGDCLEGLASGPALLARYGISGEALSDAHEGFDLVARYIAQALTTLLFALAPQRIVIGGGLGTRPGFLARVRLHMRKLGGNYPPASTVVEALDTFVVPPALGELAGVLGAIALAAGEEEHNDD